MSTDEKPYTPNMDKLRADLGRVPPAAPKSSPEDFAPKPKVVKTEDDADAIRWPVWEAECAQGIKKLLRTTTDWSRLTSGECEALDRMATDMARVVAGRNYWSELAEWAALGGEANSYGNIKS